MRGAQLDGQRPERGRVLPEAGALQGRRRGFEGRQFLGGDGNEAAQGVRPQPPTPPVVAAGLEEFQRPEGHLHGVAQAFGRPPADGKPFLDVGESHPAARSLKADGQAHDVRQAFVAHPALSGSAPVPRLATIAGAGTPRNGAGVTAGKHGAAANGTSHAREARTAN